ncbi:transducin family protein [Actinidia rufa]|uniref:Transducin family protein n=1 Tax=Actinidia rufa TaxID=165716 RepID=A0A7J0ETL0_9ERIC|nr:transducin family protein [Actinidia rufa]
MDIDLTEYQLSRELRGHEDDVRGICVCGDVGIATSSRDKTIRFWSLDPASNHNYTTSKLLLGHTSFVGPLAWVSPDEEFPEGGIVSGGMDTLVMVWDLRTGEAVQTLKGHQLQVTGIALDGLDIVSSSVDCTLRRWRKDQPVDAWEAHKAAIQAVIKLPSGELVTDTVRSLAVMPGLGILSASHDGSIRLWAISGQVLMEMVGHTSIVYSVDSHTSGLLLVAVRTVLRRYGKLEEFCENHVPFVLLDGVCAQSIEHPGCVWDVKFLENGDIATACSDGVVRIWTVHQDKIAESSELESFTSQLSHYKCSRKRVGGLKLEELPGLEALQLPGTSDGQTKVVREGDNGVAYAWNLREQKWDKIGEVVDGPDDSNKHPVLNGIQYDYVFDVDIGDGEPIRKLPYNRSDAEEYCVEGITGKVVIVIEGCVRDCVWRRISGAIVIEIFEERHLGYQRMSGSDHQGQRDFALDSSFRDPYTGSSAYVPGGSSNMNASSAKPTFKHIPKKGMLAFDVAQFDGILKKISEFNSALLSDLDNKNLSLTEFEVLRLGAIVKILKDTSHYHSSTFSDADIALLLKLVKSWPIAMIFPGELT